MKLVHKEIRSNLIRIIVLLCLFGHYGDTGCMSLLTQPDEGPNYYVHSEINTVLTAMRSVFIPGAEAQEESNNTYSKQGIKFLTSESANGKGFTSVRRNIENQAGDSLSRTGHGSGSYTSETTIEFYSINATGEFQQSGDELDDGDPLFYNYLDYNSIASKNDSLFTTYSGTSFPLPRQRSLDFASKWSDATHATSKEDNLFFMASYMYVTKLNKSSSLAVDQSDLGVIFDADFQGAADIQHRSQSINYMDRYLGTFRITEVGTSDKADFSSSGTGYVDIDRKIKKEGITRSYEHGTGDFSLEEQIASENNYLEKNIIVTYKPVKLDVGFGNSLNHSLKWSEGVSTQEVGGDRLSEKFTSLDNMEKDTIVSDLTQMQTEANYTGKGEFSVKARNITRIEEYTGEYSIRRNVSIVNYPRYNKAHIKVIKEVYFDPANCNIVNYKITLTNDGNSDLWPIFVKDTFPLGSTFLESSQEPIELTTRYANWSIDGLNPGESTSIELTLNLEKQVDKLTNRVRATAYTLSSSNRLTRTYSDYNSTIMLDPSRCAPQELLLSIKPAQDADNKHNITYRLTLENQADYNMSVNLSADIPNDVKLLTSSPKATIIGENNLSWSFKLNMGKKKTLSYKVSVKGDGLTSSRAIAYARSLDGQRHSSRELRSSVFIAKPKDLSVTRTVDDWLPEYLADPLAMPNTDASVPCSCLLLPNDTINLDRPKITLVRYIPGYDKELSCC